MNGIPTREQIEAELRYRAEHKIESYYPETGALRRELYPKHVLCFALGKTKNERLFMAANRVGKTDLGAYETALHLTGRYPDWFPGRRFTRPISAWAAGQTSKTTRDIIQLALLGKGPSYGTGMIPADAITGTTPKAGLPEAVETIYVKHASGGRSEIGLKSYDQGVESFYGTGKDLVWLDEEAERAIYVEALTRTLSTRPGQPNGLMLFTFTPLAGTTDIVRDFLEADRERPDGQKAVITATWDDVPHLTPETKAQLFREIPEYQRDARTKGIPQLGSGAIYPVTDADILVEPFAIPKHWPRGYGLDVGWNKTAAIWGAKDLESGILYLYSEHYMGKEEPYVHSQAIKSRGAWIPGWIDPAAKGRSQKDGEQLIELYRKEGLKLQPAVNAVEAGIYACYEGMTTGKIKAFTSLKNWYSELRLYQRDKDGKVRKQNDHAMDGTRYLVMSGWEGLRTAPADRAPVYVQPYSNTSERWMQ